MGGMVMRFLMVKYVVLCVSMWFLCGLKMVSVKAVATQDAWLMISQFMVVETP